MSFVGPVPDVDWSPENSDSDINDRPVEVTRNSPHNHFQPLNRPKSGESRRKTSWTMNALLMLAAALDDFYVSPFSGKGRTSKHFPETGLASSTGPFRFLRKARKEGRVIERHLDALPLPFVLTMNLAGCAGPGVLALRINVTEVCGRFMDRDVRSERDDLSTRPQWPEVITFDEGPGLALCVSLGTTREGNPARRTAWRGVSNPGKAHASVYRFTKEESCISVSNFFYRGRDHHLTNLLI